MILDVAFELFLERGYKGTSMDAIARGAGVTKPVVYSCFPSKSELFLALLDREEQRMLERLGLALAAGTRQEDLEETLTAGFTSVLRAVIDTPEAYRMALLGGGDADTLIDARVRRGRERQVSAVAAMAGAWLESLIPPSQLDMTARFIGQTLVSIGEGGVRMMLTSPGEWTPESLGRALGKLAAHGCAALGEGLPG
jgi:AcrR family transcriptional regulator